MNNNKKPLWPYLLTAIIVALSIFTNFKARSQAPANCIKIVHTHYWYYYDTAIKAPMYTYYIQTTAHAAMGSLDRSPTKTNPKAGFPTFHEDTLIPKRFRIATKAKYQKWNKANGKLHRLDVGHSAPFTALAYDSTGAIESMNLDQCGPQAWWFNEHPWEGVEMYVLKKLAPVHDSISVWTGYIYDTLNVIPQPGNMKFMYDVPQSWYYWKVIKYKDGPVTVYRAWLGLNDDSNKDNNIEHMQVDVPVITKLTGLNF